MKIGFIAHDAKKRLMQDFCVAYESILAKHELYATGVTGRLIEEATSLKVHKYISGSVGGIEQICAQIDDNDLDLIIFLRDPQHPRSHEPQLYNITKSCDTYNIPLATNLATAELMILALDRGDFEFREAYR